MKKSKVWAKDLADVLKRWCEVHGYDVQKRLAEELSIPIAAWERIMRGRSVIGKADPQAYAKIYIRTGLPEADPRGIPPRAKKIPVGEGMKSIEVSRAWSGDKYFAWLMSVMKDPSHLAAYAREELLRNFLEVLANPEMIESLIQQFGREAETSPALFPHTEDWEVSDSDMESVAKAADKLAKALWPFLWGDSDSDAEMRTQLMRAVGRSSLGEVYSMLNALVQENQRQREKAVRGWQLSRRMSGEV